MFSEDATRWTDPSLSISTSDSLSAVIANPSQPLPASRDSPPPVRPHPFGTEGGLTTTGSMPTPEQCHQKPILSLVMVLSSIELACLTSPCRKHETVSMYFGDCKPDATDMVVLSRFTPEESGRKMAVYY